MGINLDKIATVVINEQHTILPDQQRLLDEFDEITIQKIPSDGLNVQKQEDLAKRLCLRPNVIFISPVPYLMCLTVADARGGVWVMHNDQREKKELPNGKVISVTAKEGWQSLKVV